MSAPGNMSAVLDPSAAMPLYAQIAAQLRAQILAGGLSPGDRIPSEHELSSRYGVGRPTVRQATEVLVREGVLERRRGSGTYVNDAPKDVDLFSATGTLSSFEKSGLSLTTKIVVRTRKVDVSTEEKQPFAGREAYFVARRGAVDGVPVLLEEMYFEPASFPGLDRQTIAGQSISRLARDCFSLRPTSAVQRLTLFATDPRRAELLEVRAKTPVLKVERTVDFHGAKAAHYAELFLRTDRVAFTQTLSLE